MLFNIHIFAMLFSVGIIFLADKEAFAWVLGKKPLLPDKRVHLYHYLMWAGLLSLIVSGFFMFLPNAEYLLTEPLFIIKMLFVATLVCNAILIGRLTEIALTRTFASLSWGELMPLFVVGAVSAFSWASTILIAFYFFG